MHQIYNSVLVNWQFGKNKKKELIAICPYCGEINNLVLQFNQKVNQDIPLLGMTFNCRSCSDIFTVRETFCL